MNGFEKRRHDKQRAIKQAALELFDRFGFDKVTVTEIAEKAHVSKVSIYNFFGSKDNLRRLIIKDLLDESTARIRALIEKEADFIDKIEEYLQIRTWYFGKYSLRFFFDAVESDSELRRYLNDFNASSKKLVLRFIEEGKRSGVFSRAASSAAIEIYIDMVQTHLMHNREVRDRVERNPELAREINLLFLDGLIRGKDSPRASAPTRASARSPRRRPR